MKRSKDTLNGMPQRRKNSFGDDQPKIVPITTGNPEKVAGIGSNRRLNSPRKGGRFHVGIMAGLASEWWPNCVGIRRPNAPASLASATSVEHRPTVPASWGAARARRGACPRR